MCFVNGSFFFVVVCSSGYKEIVSFLIAHGANVLLKSSSGETAFHIAAAHGKHEICKMIADQEGVDLFAKDNEGVNNHVQYITNSHNI